MEKQQPTDNSSMNTMAINQRLDQLIEINSEILDATQQAEGHLNTIKILIIILMVMGGVAVLISLLTAF